MLTVSQSQLQQIVDQLFAALEAKAASIPVVGPALAAELGTLQGVVDSQFAAVYAHLAQLEVATVDALFAALKAALPPGYAPFLAVVQSMIDAALAKQMAQALAGA